ncbi:MAG: spore coat protein U domain-containing protein [Alphaproteobacteria bacterium]|nr:spore coat protein U domain-containing protein [Alphaproteobacteria bacterium]MBT5390021.1 spore coat protein U domain-containing protein [Alphaproteobacteria bacterium]
MTSIALILVGALVMGTAKADSSNDSFQVLATVVASCTVTSNDLNFGTYEVSGIHASSNLNATGSLDVNCTQNIAYDIGMDNGLYYGAGGRQMESLTGTDKLSYQIYRDSSRSSQWGAVIGSNTESDIGTGIIQSHTLYGTIPGGQSAAVDDYSDTIVVSVTF